MRRCGEHKGSGAVFLALKMKNGLQAEEYWQPVDSRKGKDWILLLSFQRNTALPTPFRILVSRAVQ